MESYRGNKIVWAWGNTTAPGELINPDIAGVMVVTGGGTIVSNFKQSSSIANELVGVARDGVTSMFNLTIPLFEGEVSQKFSEVRKGYILQLKTDARVGFAYPAVVNSIGRTSNVNGNVITNVGLTAAAFDTAYFGPLVSSGNVAVATDGSAFVWNASTKRITKGAGSVSGAGSYGFSATPMLAEGF